MIHDYLPISREDMEKRNWEQCDFVYVTGDAYVDHPSFGHAIISRILESHGYKVGIIAQPDWKNADSVRILGEPRLGYLVSAGNMDSMVNHYSVSKKRRAKDSYTPGGEMGKRPDYATVVYCNLIRSISKKPIIIGGIEASLRRLAHYDYWSGKMKRSILLDSQADLLSYGMGERSIVEIADALNSGIDIRDITFIDGTVYRAESLASVYDEVMLPSYKELTADKKEYAKSFYTQYCNTDAFSGRRLVEPYGEHLYVVQNPAARPLSEEEMDDVYALPYMRNYHPSYESAGGIPAITEVKFSLISNRGCFGGCSFCALTFHQGRIVQTRSHESIVNEAELLTKEPDFKGYIHDVGGPTANFRHPSCEKQMKAGVCPEKQCLFPKPCRNLNADHSDYISLLKKLREIPKVKKVFIRSGIRFDYLLADPGHAFLKELCEYHVSGQLKVAPEHISDNVLKRMGKPENSVYRRFMKEYEKMNEKLGKKQYLVPYLMSSHPGSTLTEAVELAEYLRDLGYMPEQVQDFYPTPSTLSTCMYYTGYDPRTMEKVYVPTNPHEKAMQRALIQYRNPKNYELVAEALKAAGRTDLIGFDKKCLIRPRQTGQYGYQNYNKKRADGKPERKADGRAGKGHAGKSADKPARKKTIRNVHKKAGR
ncbi:YgiQ family radical SAM protein [[Clostridium] symbiosum]|uniref:YgiQ family radical SAM protein n=1 Tax=Clostridium symbiosum TaxID=1512 RepID=UPI002108C5E2|nr:YgiQ family radical SAM protein [[Clostridium] symbiosum]MCQ4835624.1 YgiQ family radical SAM protein [[Clostridium] symbiosum]